jgi:hypothetical protein
MTVTSKAVPSVDHHSDLNEVPPTSSASDIDFFKARDRLSARFEETSQECEIKRKIRKVAARRMPPVRRIDRLEESLYWLLWAATLVYLLLWIIGL